MMGDKRITKTLNIDERALDLLRDWLKDAVVDEGELKSLFDLAQERLAEGNPLEIQISMEASKMLPFKDLDFN